MKEVELFKPVKNLLLKNGCSQVYGEVLGCDVLGIDGALDIIVELKKNLSFKLLDQVIDRKHLGHYNYIAVPKRKSYIPRSVKQLLEIHNIGLIEIEKDKWSNKLVAYVTFPARFNRLATQTRKQGFGNIRKHIKDYNSVQIGGVKSGEAITDYSVTIDNIKFYLEYNKRNKWATVDEILEHCETHYANPKPSVMATLQAKWNSEWCETKKENGKRYFRYKPKKAVK